MHKTRIIIRYIITLVTFIRTECREKYAVGMNVRTSCIHCIVYHCPACARNDTLSDAVTSVATFDVLLPVPPMSCFSWLVLSQPTTEPGDAVCM